MANKTISGIATAATAGVGTDLLEIEQGGVSKKVTLDNLSKGANQDNIPQGTTTKKLTAAEYAILQDEQTYLRHAMREVNFEALAQRRREHYAGSGFIEWGKYRNTSNDAINEGMQLRAHASIGVGYENILFLGNDGSVWSASIGASSTEYPIVNVNGCRVRLQYVGNRLGAWNGILLPPAPNDASILTRYDLVILEVWHELVSDKDVFYWYGNTQDAASSHTPAGGGAITFYNNGSNGTNFTGYETYSLFGNWQSASAIIGYCVQWSTLSAANKALLLRNPEHNLYLNSSGQLVQVRYRIRTIQASISTAWADIDTQGASALQCVLTTGAVKPKGKLTSITADLAGGSSVNESGVFYTKGGTLGTAQNIQSGTWIAGNGNNLDTRVAYLGYCFALPVALVYRQRNFGIYHVTHNPAGCAAKNVGQPDPTSTAECFSIAHNNAPGTIASGATANPSGKYVDEIATVDFTGGVAGDYRNQALSMRDFERGLRKYLLRYITTADALSFYPYVTTHTPSTDYKSYGVAHDTDTSLICFATKRSGNDITHTSTGKTSGNKIGAALVEINGKLKLQTCTEPTSGSDDGVITLNSATGKKLIDIGQFTESGR